jgi:hypothetical protein
MADLAPAPVRATVDQGDHDLMAHLVRGKDKLTEALINGTPVTALCGKTWVPTRDPNRFPRCPTCVEIAQAMGAVI